MFNTQGSELYKDLLSHLHHCTDTLARGDKLDLSRGFDVANDIMKDYNRSNDLMETAMHFYDPGDVCESHAVNVAVFSLKMAMDMKLSEEDIQDTLVSALYHDVGFGRILRSLQTYEGLFDEEFLSKGDLALVRRHVEYGYEGIHYHDHRGKRIGEIILQHHERADGSGYPGGRRESEMWLPARIISIVDTYETLIHPRPYRDALVPPRGIETITRQTGTAFSSHMIKALINALSLYPVGQFVRLNNGMIGKVIKTHSENPVRPDVLVHINGLGEKLETPRVMKLIEDHVIFVDRCLPGFGGSPVTGSG